MLKLAVAALVTAVMASQAAASPLKPVIGPSDLSAEINAGATVIDIRAPKDYRAGHVPGALNAPYGQWRGSKDNPGRRLSDTALTDLLQGLGLTRDARVIVAHAGKNETDFGAAARVYWTLKSAGLGQISILNGGYGAWTKAKLPVSTDPSTAKPSSATFALSDEWLIDRPGVEAVLDGSRAAIMVDARPAEFWKGEKKHAAAQQAGTLEGALNITHSTWFRGSKTEIVTGPDVLRLAQEAGYKPGRTELVSFCNTGHWAATNWFALSELAGIEGVKLYPESLVGWTLLGGAVVNGG